MISYFPLCSPLPITWKLDLLLTERPELQLGYPGQEGWGASGSKWACFSSQSRVELFLPPRWCCCGWGPLTLTGAITPSGFWVAHFQSEEVVSALKSHGVPLKGSALAIWSQLDEIQKGYCSERAQLIDYLYFLFYFILFCLAYLGFLRQGFSV